MRIHRTARATRLLPAIAALFAAVPAVAHEDPAFMASRQAPLLGPIRVDPGGPAPVEFPSSNVSLLAWLPLDAFGQHKSGADCWGYVSPSGREYALMLLSDGTAFVDVTDPGAPEVIDVIAGPTSAWRDIKVYQDRAYAVSEGGGGIQVFSLTNIDSGQVALINTVLAGEGPFTTHNVAIDEQSGFLYRTGGGNGPTSKGIRAYSLANKDNPVFVGSWHLRYVHDAQVVTYTSGPFAGMEVAFCFTETGSGGGLPRVDILDVTNKASIKLLTSVSYPNPFYSHQGWLSPDRKLLYVNDELEEIAFGTNTVTHVMDVSDLNAPFLAGSFGNGTTASDHNLFVHGDLIVEANYRSGLRVFDASSNPIQPVEIAWFDTFPQDDIPALNGLWAAYPFLPSGTIFGSDIEKGLFVWRLGPPELAFDVTSALGDLIDPGGQIVQVKIKEAAPGTLDSTSVRLHFDTGSGFSSVPMAGLGNGLFQAALPALSCGTAVYSYVSAKSSSGVTWTSPQAAPTFVYKSVAATSEQVLVDLDMETDPGWIVGAPGDTATTGIWTRVNPIGTVAQPEDDHSEPGTMCWVTGQGSLGGDPGENDVDGGKTTLRTGLIDLSGGDAQISYWRWYSNTAGAAPNANVFTVDITANNGANWKNVETVGPSGSEVVGGWIFHSFRVSDFVVPSAQVRVRFVATDGVGSLVEAAIDDFRVVRFDCTAVCQTDLGFGGPGNATLSICGQPLASGNHATLRLEGAPPNAPALLAVGLQNNPTPALGGTFVPMPVFATLGLVTDALGEIELNVPGGGGPTTAYGQFVIANPAEPEGAELSNALRIQVDP